MISTRIFNSTSSRSIPHFDRTGLTLIEILIALTMTLIVLGAMMSAFQYASAEMQNGRAMLEMANRVRVAENLLRRDLANLTVEPRPYIDKVIPNGYFEYIEGPRRDLQPPFGVDTDNDGVPNSLDDAPTSSHVTGTGIQPFFDYPVDATVFPDRPNYQPADSRNPEATYLGDMDDILAMTVRSIAGQVFRGRLFDTTTGATGITESAFAEVIWWTSFGDSDNDQAVSYTENVTLFRRVLVINPDLALPTGLTYTNAINWLAASDVSARIELAAIGSPNTYNLVPNSLQDLANRRNRFARSPATESPLFFRFPYPLNRGALLITSSADWDGIGSPLRYNGNDVVLSDVAGFDVKTFASDALAIDAGALLAANGAVDTSTSGADNLIEPSDPSFATRYQVAGTNVVPFSIANANTSGTDAIPFDGIDDQAARVGSYVDLAHFGTGQFSHPVDYNRPPGGPVALYFPRGWFVPSVGSISLNFTAQTVPRDKLYYQFNFHQADLGSNPPTIGGMAVSYAGLLDVAYDSWTPSYESDGINQDSSAMATTAPPAMNEFLTVAVQAGDTLTDEGTNGIDDVNPVSGSRENGPDDFNERETVPPYLEPISGLKVTIRLVEKQSGEVRQSSIVQSYGAQ